MIEVLVTLMIICIGFLNMAALQTTAKKSNYDAVQRTTAVILAQDIAERMRANSVALGAYLTTNAGNGNFPQPSPLCTSVARCSPLQLAALDLYLWERAIMGATETRTVGSVTTQTGGLVNPTACVTGPTLGGGGVYTITIAWRGLTPLTNVSSNTCGNGQNKYGTNEVYRRLLTFSTFISP